MTTNQRNVEVFTQQLDALAKKWDIDILTVFKKVVFDAWRGIILKSPVDTGRFRSSWTLATGSPDTSVKPEGKYSAGPEMVGIAAQLNLSPNGLDNQKLPMVWINNSLPYAERLEKGWSSQAPAGMVMLTVHEIETEISVLASTL